MIRITGNWLTNPATRQVMRMLTQGGYQAYFVGGCVRNALLGLAVADIDIATNALPDRVMALAGAAGLGAVPTGIEHGTVTVLSSGLAHEITTFRRDVRSDGRHAVVEFSDDLTEDARRRDFTMNALYATENGSLYDPLDGIGDLRAGRVRFVGNADDRIKEDYLRALRFFRFYAWYGDCASGMDADALAAISVNLGGLDTLSRERVGAEVKKLLSAVDPAPAIGSAAQVGVLARILPGADHHFLAPLVALDATETPSAIRRLAVLGGANVADDLRLSRKENRNLALLRTEMGTARPIAELAYRHGAVVATDIELLRAAIFERPVAPDLGVELTEGEAAEFPVKPADLMPEFQGPALGACLKELEQRWISSHFSLSKSQLLDGLDVDG